MKGHKYRAQAVVVDGIKFTSKAEGRRYRELQLMLVAGQIAKLELQPSYILAPTCKLGGKTKRALVYRADFRYLEISPGKPPRLVVEDVKGMRTAVYRVKQHLMMTVHGIEITEIAA